MEANYYFTTQNGHSMTFEQYPDGDWKVVKFDNDYCCSISGYMLPNDYEKLNEYARHIADICNKKGGK